MKEFKEINQLVKNEECKSENIQASHIPDSTHTCVSTPKHVSPNLKPSPLALKSMIETRENAWKEKLHEMKNYDVSNCLKRHKITKESRAKIVDLLMILMNELRFSTLTFFKAISMLDLYLKNITMYFLNVFKSLINFL